MVYRSAIVILFLVCLLPVQASAQLHLAVVSAGSVVEASDSIGEQSLRFVSDGGRSMDLVLDPRLMEISNPIVGDRFYPMSEDLARRILAQMSSIPPSQMEITIYLLPGMPSAEMSSFCSGAEVFIAPALAGWKAESGAYTLCHELGHAVQHLGLPARRGRGWSRYLQLRGLQDSSVYSEDAVHRDRPAEIFAEDFRVLFGGMLATTSGTQEKGDLPLPGEVEGLRQFFLEVIGLRWLAREEGIIAGNHPNPFNPSTVISLALNEELVAAGGVVEVRIVDTRGRVVKDFGGQPPSARLELRWKGRDQRGMPVASGRYIYQVRAGEVVTSGSMILLK